jgi:dephospho-CoA kinase
MEVLPDSWHASTLENLTNPMLAQRMQRMQRIQRAGLYSVVL